MVIDLENGYYRGLGDAICVAWIARGAELVGEHFEAYALKPRRIDPLTLFEVKITQSTKNRCAPLIGFETCVREGLPYDYIRWIMFQIGATWEVARPRPAWSAWDRECGRKDSAEVLMFPQMIWPPRAWPKNYWIELGMMLKDAGINLKVVLKEPDPTGDFSGFHQIVGKPIAHVAAACSVAKLVITNESGPAHVAGAVGAKVLAICGPTTPKIYGHEPNVFCFQKKAVPCYGCHFKSPPFRYSCGIGCHELYRTLPEDVFQKAYAMLSGKDKPVYAPSMDNYQPGMCTVTV